MSYGVRQLGRINKVAEVRQLRLWRLKGEVRVGSVELRAHAGVSLEEVERLEREGTIVLENAGVQKVTVGVRV